MDISANIKVPDYVYQFYRQAAENIAGTSTEQIMADALMAYATILSAEVRKTRNALITEDIPQK